jgi:hypothetical protein
MRRRIFVFLSVLAMVQTTTAAAQTQTTPPLWTAGATAGFGQTWDDEGSLGRGLLLSGHVERRFTKGLSLECGVDWLAHDRGEGVFQADGHTTLLAAAVKYSWTSEAATSYVLGGLVMAHHTGTTRFEDEVRADRTMMPGVSVGGGVLFPASNGWRVGPEGRLLLLSPGNEEAPALGMYAGVRVSLPLALSRKQRSGTAGPER